MTPFTSEDLLKRLLKTEGILPIISHSKVTTDDITDSCDDVVEMYSDWDSEQGFGSSDMTHAVKSVIDQIIRVTGIPYTTQFNPVLEVIKEG